MATLPQDRAQFLAERQQGLGGSDMAAIMGLSPFRSPMDVFLEKIGEAAPTEETEAMYWGTQLEDLVAREFARRTGYKVQRRTQMYRHPQMPYLIGHIDRLVVNHPGGPAILDAKTTSAYHKAEWADGQAPLHYLIQVNHYMDITSYQHGYLAVLIGGNDFRIVPVERNDDLIQQMHEAAEAFWLCVETRTPPVIDGSAATAAALKALYPQGNGQTVALPPEGALWVAQYHVAQQAMKEAESLKTEAENQLKALLGEAEIGTLPGYQVQWKTASRTSVDTKALPDAIKRQYSKTTTYRTFSIKEAK